MLQRFPTLAPSCWRPAADVYRTADGWLIKIELAGVSEQDVQIEVHGSELTVSGQRRDLHIELGCHCQSLEISYDRFERTFEFPCALAAGDPQIRFDNGMLWLRVKNCPT